MKKVNLFLICFYSLFIHCSLSLFSSNDGGSSSEVIAVIGNIVNNDGATGQGTQVFLISNEYNPIKDGPITDSLIDTTDSLGFYHFTIPKSDSGIYNIQAVHNANKKSLLITNLAIREDTVSIPVDTLKDPGAIKLFLPDTIDTADAYVYIRGTTLYGYLSETVSDSNGYSITLDSVPEAMLYGIHYGKINDPLEPVLLSDTVTVIPNDTVIIEAFISWVNYTTENSGLRDNEVMDILITSDGSKWFATTGGVAKLDGADWTLYHMGNSGLPDDWVRSVTMDKSGNIWFAMGVDFKDGVAKFDGVTWTGFNENNSGLPYNSVNHVMCDNDGNIWACMDEGIDSSYGAAKFDGTTWTGYDSVNSGLPSNIVRQIAQDNNNTLWFATNGGVAQFDGTTWTVYNTTNSGIGSNTNYSIRIELNGNIWFGHEGSLSKFDGSNWTVYDNSYSDLLSVGGVQTIAEDTHGNIWIGTMWGLIKFDGITWTDYDGERYKLLDGKAIYAISFDSDNNMWLGTWRSGVIAFGPTVK